MSQPTPGRFVWHDLMTTDREASKAFYADLLGWSYETWKPGELDYPMLDAGGGPFGGMVPLDPGHGIPCNWQGYVHVADLDAALAHVPAAGGTVFVGATPIPEVGRFAVVGDPTGAAVSLMQPAGALPPEAPPTPGSVAWHELQSTDLAAAAPFYVDVLGWAFREQPVGEIVYGMFSADGTDVAGGITFPPGVEAPSHWLTYFHVEDVDAALARAAELGATTLWGPLDVEGIGRMAGLLDPLGAVFAVFRAAMA
ncbi:MAG: VOC family protein [Thermoleophilia bacterium]